MSYINYTDFVTRYNIVNTNSASNVFSDMLYYAEKEVEGALSPGFSVPFSAAHPTVKDLCIDMAYVRWLRMHDPKSGIQLNEELYKRISKICEGKEPLVTGSGTLSPISSGADLPESTTEDYHPVHSMLGAEDELTRISSEWIQDLENERI